MKKFLSRILILSVVCAAATSSASAFEFRPELGDASASVISDSAVRDPRSNIYIESASASIRAGGSGSITVNFVLKTSITAKKLGVSSVSIYEDGTLVKTFTTGMSSTSGMRYSGSVDYAGKSGKTYYASVKFFAEDTVTVTETKSTKTITA